MNVEANLRKYLYRYYKDYEQYFTQEDLEQQGIINEDTIFDHIHVVSLIVDHNCRQDKTEFHIYGEVFWEEEHCLEITISDNKILYVGPYMGYGPNSDELRYALQEYGYYDPEGDPSMNYIDEEQRYDMTKEEYIEKMNNDDEWAPGWDAIDNEFARIYPDIKPSHYGTNIQARARFGGNQYLDGYSIFDTGKGYRHIVTYGMSNLYADEEAYGQPYSGCGYEMTIKLKANNDQDCMWAIDSMSMLARYTYKNKRYYENEQCIQGNGTSLRKGYDSKITAFITVNDTTLETQDTLHGKLEFIQLVGITESELDAIRNDFHNIHVLVELMKKDNPELITDMDRTKSYL